MRANERPILPQAVCPALSCRGWRRRAVCGSGWPWPGLQLWALLGLSLVLVSGGFGNVSEWWHRHTGPDHIFHILNIDWWFSPDYIFTRALDWQLPHVSWCRFSASSDHHCISKRTLPASPSALISCLLSLIFPSLKASGSDVLPGRSMMLLKGDLCVSAFPSASWELQSHICDPSQTTSYSKSVIFEKQLIFSRYLLCARHCPAL